MTKRKIIASLANVSHEAVTEATGKDWTYWIKALDKKKAAELAHKEIVALLHLRVEKAWWRQKIALGYREAKGKRVVGQIPGGYQIGVRKIIAIPKAAAWSLMTSPEAMNVWLGHTISLDTNDGSQSKKGLTTALRVFKPGSHLRLAWQPRGWKDSTTLQVRTIATGKKTEISFHHEGLPTPESREAMKAHWRSVLEKLEALALKQTVSTEKPDGN